MGHEHEGCGKPDCCQNKEEGHEHAHGHHGGEKMSLQETVGAYASAAWEMLIVDKLKEEWEKAQGSEMSEMAKKAISDAIKCHEETKEEKQEE